MSPRSLFELSAQCFRSALVALFCCLAACSDDDPKADDEWDAATSGSEQDGGAPDGGGDSLFARLTNFRDRFVRYGAHGVVHDVQCGQRHRALVWIFRELGPDPFFQVVR